MRAALTALLVATLLALAACGDDDDSGEESATSVDEPCEPVTAPEPRTVDLAPPPKKPSADRLTAAVDTSCGSFEIALDTADKSNIKLSSRLLSVAQSVRTGVP